MAVSRRYMQEAHTYQTIPKDWLASAGDPCSTAVVSCSSALGLHDSNTPLAAAE